jgi:Rieske Fe-S protein
MNSEMPGKELWTRRHWVKQFMLGSAAAFGVGGIQRSRLLADISPSVPPTDILTLHIAQDFPEMLSGNTPSIQVQISGFPEVIMMTLVSAGMYVLNSKCTHLGCTVNYWQPDVSILCPCHGSNYNVDGSLIIGAVGNTQQAPLAAYNFNWDGIDLQIEVPGLNLTVNKVAVESIVPGNTRLRLDFPGRALSTYEVFYTPDLMSDEQQVLFSLTADGAADQSSIDIGDDDTPTSVWVDNSDTQGFYSIALVVTQLNY